MDGVLADFDTGVQSRLRQRHPDVPFVTTRTNFYISDDYPEHVALVRALSDEEGFFESLPLVYGALSGWHRMLELGYEPRICSSPLKTNPTCVEGKKAWLEEHFVPEFGSGIIDDAIFTSTKHLYNGVALLDDRPTVKDADKATWQHIIFDRPYNRHVEGPRLIDWDVYDLECLLADAVQVYGVEEA